MQKRRIMLVSLVVAIVVIATVSYEFFVANSLSSYTKITLTPLSADYQPCSIKFDNTTYYIVFFHVGYARDPFPLSTIRLIRIFLSQQNRRSLLT